jgi:hypothetical protein
MYVNIKAFKVKLQLQQNQLKLHNLVHFPHAKFLDIIFPECTQEYSQSILFFSRTVSRMIPELQNYGTRSSVVGFTFKGRH